MQPLAAIRDATKLLDTNRNVMLYVHRTNRAVQSRCGTRLCNLRRCKPRARPAVDDGQSRQPQSPNVDAVTSERVTELRSPGETAGGTRSTSIDRNPAGSPTSIDVKQLTAATSLAKQTTGV